MTYPSSFKWPRVNLRVNFGGFMNLCDNYYTRYLEVYGSKQLAHNLSMNKTIKNHLTYNVYDKG